MVKLSRIFIISVIALALLLSGCNSKGTDPSGETGSTTTQELSEPSKEEAKQEKPVKILWRNSRELDEGIGAEAKKYIEDGSGVKFEVARVVAFAEFDQRVGVSLASQEDIDMVMLRNLDTYTDLSSKGSLMKLNDLLEKYASNLLKLYSQEEWKATTYKNGNIYAIPKTAARTGEIISVRKDRMDKLGIASIDTIDDLEKYLRGLKDSDFDGNGQKDTCTLLSCERFGPLDNSLSYLFTEVFSFSPGGVYLDSAGNVTPSALHPGYKDYLLKMSQWYKEGLIYKDTYTLKNAQVEDLVIANKVGAAALWFTSHIRPWETLKAAVPEAEYMYIAPKTVKGNPYTLIAPAPASPHIGVVTYSKNAEFALKLLDWISASKENYFTTKQGIMGKDWEWAGENKETYKDLKNDSKGDKRYWYHYGFLNYVAWDAKANNPTFLNAKSYEGEYYQRDLNYVVKPDWFVTYNWKGTPLENALQDAKTMITEAADKIILGLLPVDEWDRTISEYRKLYADEFIKLATETYKEYAK